MNRFEKYTKHELMMALADRETRLSFARNWCNMILIEQLEEEINEIRHFLKEKETS